MFVQEAKDTAREGRDHAQLIAAAEAEAWLGSLLLSGRVSSGLAPFARLAGSPSAADVTHQAKRWGELLDGGMGMRAHAGGARLRCYAQHATRRMHFALFVSELGHAQGSVGRVAVGCVMGGLWVVLWGHVYIRV